MKPFVPHLAVVSILGVSALVATQAESCSCTATQQCQLLRALCKIDVCIKTDPQGWQECQGLSEDCGVDRCLARSECTDAFLARCTARMTPGQVGYEAYTACGNLDCTNRPPAMPGPDAAAPAPDAAPVCAGTLCDGRCCTGYPCFAGKRCTCLSSVAECAAPDAGTDLPPITSSCCSDAPLCSSQGKLCCFVAPSATAPAQTRCLSSCSSESRHCTFAPYLQSDGTRSCLPPPYDRAMVQCPF